MGAAGLRLTSEGGDLDLSCRLLAEARGQGLGREAARHAVAHAAEWLPDLPVRAVVAERDVVALRTALAAGLESGATETRVGDPDPEPRVVLEAPRAARLTALDPATREAVLDLWCRVNDAGGAVGFLPGAPRDRVDAALGVHEEQLAAGLQTAVVLRAAGGEVAGLGFWAEGRNPLLSHVRTAYRVMTDPARRGRGLGRVLLAGMHRVARADGVEISVLAVRSGYGTARFYADSGYAEVGRLAGAIRVAPGDERDEITMARRLDGRPMTPDGRG